MFYEAPPKVRGVSVQLRASGTLAIFSNYSALYLCKYTIPLTRIDKHLFVYYYVYIIKYII